MAIRILNLTTSSSGCERNWSAFEGIHSKKRNRLVAARLNDLVFVSFNSKLKNKQKRMEKEKDLDILLAKDASNAQGWMVEDGDGDDEVEPSSGLTWNMIGEASGADEMLQPRTSGRIRNVQLRELDEDDFVSEEEMEEGNDIELEPHEDED